MSIGINAFCNHVFPWAQIHCSNIRECIPHDIFYYKRSPCQQLYNSYTANMKEVFSRAKPQWKKTLVIIIRTNEVWSNFKPWNKSHVSLMNSNMSLLHILAAHDKTNRPPNIRWKHESHTSNALRHQAWFHSARQRKEQAESRQRVKWPRDVNNLGDWGRPALINARQPCWLSGHRHRGTVLGFSPMDVLVTPLLLPQSRPPGGLFTPSRASLNPAHDNEGDVWERKRLTQTVSVKC